MTQTEQEIMVSLAEALACLSMVERFSHPLIRRVSNVGLLLDAIHESAWDVLEFCRKRQERLQEWGETE